MLFVLWRKYGPFKINFEMEKLQQSKNGYLVRSVFTSHGMILQVFLNITIIFYFVLIGTSSKHIKIQRNYDENEKA